MKMDPTFLGPSKKALVFTAALALVACTVILWGLVSHGGKISRRNAELVMRLSETVPEPQWTDELTRKGLTASLAAASPALPEDAQYCFAAPCWAIVHTADCSYLFKWQAADGVYQWTELDSVVR